MNGLRSSLNRVWDYIMPRDVSSIVVYFNPKTLSMMIIERLKMELSLSEMDPHVRLYLYYRYLK